MRSWNAQPRYAEHVFELPRRAWHDPRLGCNVMCDAERRTALSGIRPRRMATY
jgi:hypothetical protein